MKRLLLFSALILLVLFLLPACTPIDTPLPETPETTLNEDKPSTVPPEVSDNTTDKKPVYYLLDASGNKIYGVYKFSIDFDHCIAIADAYNSPKGDSNSAPALFCH